MAGVAYWSGGAGDGLFDSGGNWGTASGTPSNPPATGDGVLFDHRANGSSMTTGPGSGVDLVSFTVTRGFTGAIGTLASPIGSNLQVSSGSTATLNYAGQGDGCFLTNNVDNVEVSSTGPGQVVINGGTTADAKVTGGKVTFGASCVVTAAAVSDASVTFNANGTGVTTLAIGENARVIMERGYTTMTVKGASKPGRQSGRVVIKNSVAGTTLTNDGGFIDYQSSGTITTLNGNAGRFSNANNPWTGFTVTNANLNESQHKLDETWGGVGAITFSNTPNRFGNAAGLGDGGLETV